MSAQLTPEEHEFARRFIAGLEKRSRDWRWARLGLLVFATVCFGLAVLAFVAMVHIMQPLDTPLITLAGHNMTLTDLALACDRQISALQVGTMLSPTLLGSGLAGTLMLVCALVHWHRDRRDALFAKILRAELGLQTEEPWQDKGQAHGAPQ